MNAVKWIEIYKKIVIVLLAGLLGLLLFLAVAIYRHQQAWSQYPVSAMAEAPPFLTSPTPTWPPTATPTTFNPATATCSPTPTSSPTPTITPTPQILNPLTGLPVTDPAILDRRPVMIKVSNWPATGRPHAGLSNADIIFEYYIGYAKSRFLALFYGEDASKIGPVRSGRMVDPQLVNLYGGLLAYGNADPKVDAVILPSLGERALAFKYLPCPPMCGVDTHDATGVFSDSAATTDYALQRGINNDPPDLSGMVFNPAPPEGMSPGESVTFRFADLSLTQWQYEPGLERYLWWMESNNSGNITMIPMPDRNTGEQVTMDNIIVIFARYIEYTPTLHDIQISSVNAPQAAIFFRDGLALEGTWHVPDPHAPMVFQTQDGSPYTLKPGKTWIFIAGLSTEALQDPNLEWEFEFAIP
jgi:hypothetical protein